MTISPKPSENVVNGVYYNKCCEVIYIKGGHITYKNRDTKFRLLNMKFGLTAYPKERLILFEKNTLSRGRPTNELEAIPFEKANGKLQFTLLEGNKELIFRQVNR
jgi:hypothetical protein